MKKAYLLIIVFLALSQSSWGQGSKSALFNFLYHKQKPYYFGISLGLNNHNFMLNKSTYFINNDSINIAEPAQGYGMHVQMIVNLKIGQNFDFRLLPGFSFADRSIDYTSSIREDFDTKKRIESVYIEAPFLVRYKSRPYRDMRMFGVAGVKYTFDVNNNSRARNNQNLIKLSPHDFQFELGAGMQFFLPFFLKFNTH